MLKVPLKYASDAVCARLGWTALTLLTRLGNYGGDSNPNLEIQLVETLISVQPEELLHP